MRLLEGCTALITGTNRGIGKATLIEFAKNGATIYAHARIKNGEFIKSCKELEKIYNVKIYPVFFDVLDEDAMKKELLQIKKNGGIDVLVNNVGIVDNVSLFTMIKLEKIKESFEVNFFAQMSLTQKVSRMMIAKKKGSIINISSCAGIDGDTGMFDYVSSKAAIIGATKRLAIELGNYNIRVNAVAPGLIDTDMGNQMSEELTNETIKRCIMNRKGEPSEVANTIVFLASSMSSFITGQVIRVDGGIV